MNYNYPQPFWNFYYFIFVFWGYNFHDFFFLILGYLNLPFFNEISIQFKS